MVANRDPEPDKTEPRRVLECNVCGCRVACSAEELLRYTRERWPKCCGQVMAFYSEPTRSAPASDQQP